MHGDLSQMKQNKTNAMLQLKLLHATTTCITYKLILYFIYDFL